MKRKGIASGGSITFDYVKLIDSYPKPGNLSTILSVEPACGGAPLNCLVDLAVMDRELELQVIGVLGKDKEGDYVLDTLQRYHINTDLIYREECITSFTDVMTVRSTGERTFFHHRGSNSLLDFPHFDFSRIRAEILHVGYALLMDTMDMADEEYGTVMARTLAEAQKHGIKTSIDVVSENSERFSRIVPPSLKYSNYCIINEVEASMTTGISAREGEKVSLGNMERICRRLFEMGVQDLVVIHSPGISVGMDKAGHFHYKPSLELPEGYIKGTVGAGDAFCAGILYAIYKGWELEYALEVGNAAAACNLGSANAIDGMKSIQEVCGMINAFPKRKLEEVAVV